MRTKNRTSRGDNGSRNVAATMIIPAGAQVDVDARGQLSIRTPGNLVIQSSGRYGVLESLRGSIRIEPGAVVEAVHVRCPESCFIQGELTAWKVSAREIHLDSGARASILLQEAERIDVGRNSRLVGNFGSEKELFMLFSRFSRQARSLPFFEAAAGETPLEALTGDVERQAEEEEISAVEVASEETALPQPLVYARVLLEKAVDTDTAPRGGVDELERLLRLLRRADLDGLEQIFHALPRLDASSSTEARRAWELIRGYFDAR